MAAIKSRQVYKSCYCRAVYPNLLESGKHFYLNLTFLTVKRQMEDCQTGFFIWKIGDIYE